MNVNGFNRGQFQSFGASAPFIGLIGDLWVTTFDDHNLFLAVAPSDAFIAGTTAAQDAQRPRLFQKGSLIVKQGLSSILPKFATLGTILVTTDTKQAFVGLGAQTPIYQVNLDVVKVLNSGLVTQSFSATDPVVAPAPSGPLTTVVLFDLNG